MITPADDSMTLPQGPNLKRLLPGIINRTDKGSEDETNRY